MRYKILKHLYSTSARFVSILPWSIINFSATILSLVWYYLVPIRRGLIIDNLKYAYPEKSKREIYKITRLNLKHYCLLLFENLQLRNCKPEIYVNKVAAIRNPVPIAEAIREGRGVIFLSAHIGNFEMLGPISYFLGYPRTKIIVKPLRDPSAEELIQEIRGRWVDVILSKNGLSAALKAIRENNMVGVMLDQHAGGRGGVWVDFFGRPAGTMKLMAILADRTDASVIPAFCNRLKDGRLVFNFDPPIPYKRVGNYEENIRHNTAVYTKHIEKWVRKYPEQWFWIHRRWKEQPRHPERSEGSLRGDSSVAELPQNDDRSHSRESGNQSFPTTEQGKCVNQNSSYSQSSSLPVLEPQSRLGHQLHPPSNNL